MNKENIDILKKGGVGILMTDTIYGIVGSAKKPKTVERVFDIKKRNKRKPLIILISSLKDLEYFDIKLNKNLKEKLKKYWPGRVSIVFPVDNKRFAYLHRGKNSLAFRFPDNKRLIDTLKKTGPLVAPSANPEGDQPANSIKEAKSYFGSFVDFYEAGKGSKKASRVLEISEKEEKIIRN